MEVFKKVKFNRLEEDCVICFQTFSEDEIVFSCNRCDKSIHSSCKEKLVKYKNECPSCRFKVDSLDNNFEFFEMMILSNQIIEVNDLMFQISIFVNLCKFFFCFIFVVFIWCIVFIYYYL